MGHSLIPFIKRTKKWEPLLDLFESQSSSVVDFVSRTSKAIEGTLLDSQKAESLVDCFWFFTNIVNASGSDNFEEELKRLGIQLPNNPSGTATLNQIYKSVTQRFINESRISIVDQIIRDSFKSTIHDVICESSTSLFGTDLKTVQKAFKKYSSKNEISTLGRNFFSEYLYRIINFVLEKECARSLGEGKTFESSSQIKEFNSELKAYCQEVSFIVKDYSGGWYQKHKWQDDLRERKKTKNFVQYAITKILSEIDKREAEQ